MSAHAPEPAPSPTFEQWVAQPVVQPLASSETLGWKDLVLYKSQLYPTEEDVTGPLSDHPFLIFIVNGSTRIQTMLQGRYYDQYHVPGAMHLIPAWHESKGRWNSTLTAAFIQLSPQLITSLAETSFRGDPARVQLLPTFNFHDPLLRHLITELCNELPDPTPFGTLFAESAAHTIMFYLLRKYSTANVRLQETRARLTARQMRVIHDYVESNLDRKIALGDLATLLFMSIPHFERLFRVSFGCAPYRYVLERRMERAKLLLAHSDSSLHEIARQSGFANQSHFTRHFTRAIGVPPAVYRELLRN